MRKVLGVIMIGAPFTGLIIAAWVISGWRSALAAIAPVAMLACMITGAVLFFSGRDN